MRNKWRQNSTVSKFKPQRDWGIEGDGVVRTKAHPQTLNTTIQWSHMRSALKGFLN